MHEASALSESSWASRELRTQDESLLRHLMEAQVLPPDLLTPAPVTLGRIATRLWMTIREDGAEMPVYAFCKLHGWLLQAEAQQRIQQQALPLCPDAIVGEVFARLFQHRADPSGSISCILEHLRQLVPLTMASAVENLQRYVPGVGLEAFCCLRNSPFLRPELLFQPLTSQQTFLRLKREEYETLTAQAFLRLSQHDRRVLLDHSRESRDRVGESLSFNASHTTQCLTRSAAIRRLQEELLRSVQWLQMDHEDWLPTESRCS
jgi:hypothetical protein